MTCYSNMNTPLWDNVTGTKGAKNTTATSTYLPGMCTDKWEAILNSKILANHFKALCRDFSPPYRESNAWANRQKAASSRSIIFVLKQTRRLITEEKINAETFRNEIRRIKDLNVLHLEILWYLELFGLMTLTEFIQFHESNNGADVIEHLAQHLFDNLLDLTSNPSKIRNKMLFCYIRTVLECLKRDVRNGEISFCEKLRSFVLTNLQRLYRDEENNDVESYLEISHVADFFNNFDRELIQLFLQQILVDLLEGSLQATKSIFKKQEKVKNNLKHKKIFQFFTVMSKYCDLDFMMAQIETKLSESSRGVDWNIMLPFITFVGVHYKDGWRDLKTLTNCLINKAFQNLDRRLLSHAFLIARQGCFERSNDSFPSYLQWFSSTFSTESRRPINSQKICGFFFNFLTDILPYDSTYYLRVHLNRGPWVPTDCQSILHEYTELVKIQLNDLNVSAELGICENTTNKSAAVFDVENVIKHFERTNEILNLVFQASMFCKEYYEKKFLVELLSTFDGKKSARHKLILKLHSLGKIPSSIFKVYKSLEKNK